MAAILPRPQCVKTYLSAFRRDIKSKLSHADPRTFRNWVVITNIDIPQY